MSVDFLLEIGCEEIPAAFLAPAVEDLRRAAESLLTSNSIDFDNKITAFYTPRRLVLRIKNVAEIQSEKEVPEKGPPQRIAFDEKGEPTKAALGFAKKWGVDIASVYVEDGYVYTKVKYGGQATLKLLAESFCREFIESVNFPKTMRWEESGFRFARPIRWILALFGGETVKFQIADVGSGNFTYGHRFLAPRKIEINDPADYFDKIKKADVVIDVEARRKSISEQLTLAAKKHGVSVELDSELVAETANLVEYPVIGVGHFDKSFLEVPAPVLITAMKKHQKYFPFTSANGRLEPLFAAVNNLPSDEEDLITHGNEKVLKARLADARFFFDDDKKKPLEELVEGLKKVVFQESLGTIFEKCERLERTVQFLGELLKCQHVPEAARAARLCKTDLLTSMVYEFPELQGTMGREYARLSGEPLEVSEAIYEHYLPRFNGDELPKSDAGSLLSLAEKLDNLTGCIGVGLIPTSSQDPYGLRRQALAIVQIVLHFEYRIPLKVVIENILSHLKGKVKYPALPRRASAGKETIDSVAPLDPVLPQRGLPGSEPVNEDHDEIINQTLEQLKQRLRFVLEQTGIPYDVINSVLSQNRDDLMDMYNRAEAIVELRKDENFSSMMTTHRRVVNILKSAPEKIPELDPDLFADEAESVLREQLLKIKDKFLPLLDENNYIGAFEVLKPLRPAIDKFFDQVMVMVEDAKVKGNRFALLQEIADLFNQLADFSRIVIA